MVCLAARPLYPREPPQKSAGRDGRLRSRRAGHLRANTISWISRNATQQDGISAPSAPLRAKKEAGPKPRLRRSDAMRRQSSARFEDIVEIRMLLDGVDSDRREALLLTQVLGLSYAEAAEICGCAVGTVKSRVSRARRALQATLERGGYGRDGEAAGDAMRTILGEADRLAGARS